MYLKYTFPIAGFYDENNSYLSINVELRTETVKGKLNDCHFEFDIFD